MIVNSCFEWVRLILQFEEVGSMGICLKLNKIITLAVVVLAGLWFLLVVILPQSAHFKLRGNDMEETNDGWKVDTIFHPLGLPGLEEAGFELHEVINHGIPNIFGSQGILLVTSEWSRVNYSYLLYSLSSLKVLGERYRFPIYIVRQKLNHNLYNHRSVMQHAHSLHLLIDRCLQLHNIKRLSVIAYEEAALLTIIALSMAESSFIFKIDKLIIINPFNPEHHLYQNDPKSLDRAIKRYIMADKNRLVSFHYLRILIVNTFRTVHQQEPDSRDLFNLIFADQTGQRFQLNSTLAISSKAMWEVNTYIQKGTYFNHRPFVNLLMRVIIDDQKAKLSIQSIEYILRYRESSQIEREISRSELAKCKVMYLEQLQRSSAEVKSSCYRIVQRQRHRFHQAVLMFYSLDRIELFGEGLNKIPSSNYHSGKYHTNVITSLKDVNEIILFAGERTVHLLLTIIRSPLNNPFPTISAEEGVKVVTQHETVLMQSCQGWRPIIGLSHNQHFKELVQWKEGNCYIQLEDYNSYSQWFAYNWTIIRNIIVFSIFSTHILAVYSFRRYYTVLFVNLILLLFLLKKVYLFENMIITSTATLLEIIAMGLIKASHYLHISTHYYFIVLLLPLASQLLGKLDLGLFAFSTNSNKLLWMQLILANHQSGYLITLLKFYFMLDIYNTQQSCIYSLILLAVWQASHMPNSPFRFTTPLAKTKARLADVLFLGMLCFSLAEQASVIHQLINFYMITQLLMGAGEVVNRFMEGNQ